MTVLQIEHPINDFEVWKRNFDSDPMDRAGSGVTRFRVMRPVDDPNFVKVDLEFDNLGDAESFYGTLREFWQSADMAKSVLKGSPRVSIVETVETREL
jgi:hypothetical protein